MENNFSNMYLYLKRLFDIIVGMLGLLVLIPITIVLKIVFLCSRDTGILMFKQQRIGKDGKPFEIYKFRSMGQDADKQLKELLKIERYRKEWVENQKFEDDPRITKLGHYLRKTSIDELPQMLNLLKGDMSLVGPRPLVPGELEKHGGTELYWKVKPGITGWWASHGRSDIDYEERLKMEYYYVENCSFWIDVVCIFKTISAVLKHKGAK